MNKETVLVTGGAGAVGSNLSSVLNNMGHSVIALDDLSSGREDLVSRGVTFIKGSICDAGSMDKAFSHKPSVVFHLAAHFANQNSINNPENDLAVNGAGMLNVLQYAKQSGVRKFLYASSSCVYGNEASMNESHIPDDFDTPYALTKYLGEKYCRIWSHYFKLPTVIVRLFNSYGPGEYPGKYRNVIPNFMKLAMEKKPLTITGTGEEVRDFNYVTDTVQGIIKAVFADTKPGDIFNIGSGKGTNISKLAAMINEITGNPAGIEYTPRRDWDNVASRISDIRKAKERLGYAPEVDIKGGLNKTYEWFKSIKCG